MAGRVSNPRDLFVLLLGELLHVERRLADDVLRKLADAVADERLTTDLRSHLEQTKHHIERIETVFRHIGVAPSAHYSSAFEGAVRQHDELTPSVTAPKLADLFHAQAALHTEHWEIAAYTAVLAVGEALGSGDDLAGLRESLGEEENARAKIDSAIGRLAQSGPDAR